MEIMNKFTFSIIRHILFSILSKLQQSSTYDTILLMIIAV